jgi:hypothetical protein
MTIAFEKTRDRTESARNLINGEKEVTTTLERSTQTEPTEPTEWIELPPRDESNETEEECTRETVSRERESTESRKSVSTVIHIGAMPRPGEPGAVSFDGNDITKFLRRWKIECEDFGLTDTQKCERILYYGVDQELIEFLDGYATNDWELLQKEMKEIYWENDTHRDSMASPNTLISNASKMGLNVFIIKYSSMSGTLVERGALSILDRVNWFLDGLSEELCDRALEYCSKKDWRLSANDTGSEPSFDDLKELVLTKARAARLKAMYEKERAVREADGLTMGRLTRQSGGMTTMSIWSAPSAPTAVKSEPTPLDPRVVEVTRQIEALTLMMQANQERNRVIARRPNREKFEGVLSWRRGIPTTNEETSG